MNEINLISILWTQVQPPAFKWDYAGFILIWTGSQLYINCKNDYLVSYYTLWILQ